MDKKSTKIEISDNLLTVNCVPKVSWINPLHFETLDSRPFDDDYAMEMYVRKAPDCLDQHLLDKKACVQIIMFLQNHVDYLDQQEGKQDE